jgi:hypothetical protein
MGLANLRRFSFIDNAVNMIHTFREQQLVVNQCRNHVEVDVLKMLVKEPLRTKIKGLLEPARDDGDPNIKEDSALSLLLSVVMDDWEAVLAKWRALGHAQELVLKPLVLVKGGG